MIFTKGEDGKFTAIDGYSAEYEADQLNDELKDIVFPLLNLEDGSYRGFAASVSSMMVRSYAVAIVKPSRGQDRCREEPHWKPMCRVSSSPWSTIWRISIWSPRRPPSP